MGAGRQSGGELSKPSTKGNKIPDLTEESVMWVETSRGGGSECAHDLFRKKGCGKGREALRLKVPPEPTSIRPAYPNAPRPSAIP